MAKELKPFIDNWPEQPLDLICLVLDQDYEKEISAIKQLRGHTVVPMVLILEPISEDGEIALIEAGVDLIVTRPFGLRLLITRIRALLRRTSGVPFHSLPAMTKGALLLDPGNRTVKVGESEPKKFNPVGIQAFICAHNPCRADHSY